MTLLVMYYIVARFFGAMHGHERWGRKRNATAVYDGATFSTSILIIMGIYDTDILKLLGTTTPILGIAGLLGLIHSFNALFPDAD